MITKRKSIISVLLLAAMMLSFMSFTACGPTEGGEEEVKEMIIFVKITSSTGEILWDDDVEISVPENYTVFEATKHVCSLGAIPIEDDGMFVIKIGDDRSSEVKVTEERTTEEQVTEEVLGVDEDEDETEEGELPEDLPPTEAPTEAPAPLVYDWVVYVDGIQANQSDKLKVAQTIEWKYEIIPEKKK